ncbi:hypothetical protein BDW71DRAFT_184906 [Aspergillus fruticulosus]
MCWPHFRTFCRLIDRSHDAVCTSLTPCDTSVPRNCAQTQEQILDRLPLRGRRGDHVGSPLPSSTSTHSICRLRPGRCISFFSLTTGQLECLNTVTALICSTPVPVRSRGPTTSVGTRYGVCIYSVPMLRLSTSMFHIVLRPTTLCACLPCKYFRCCELSLSSKRHGNDP